jgi:glycosyltransferase involved in cell wall biosynthesis
MELKYDNNEIIVSAYLLTYNHEKYVEQALISMLNQKTNFKYEILIGDDCSTDNTLSILKKYKEMYPNIIKLFPRGKNLGATKNCYLLLKESKGKYIAPLEGDDYWIDENRLQYLVDFLEGNHEYVGISHRRERRDIEGNLLGYDPDDNQVDKPFFAKDFLKGKRFSVAGSVHKNYYLNSEDRYQNVLLASRNVGDFQMAMILLDIGPIYISDRCFGVYRVRKGTGESNYNSITSQLNIYIDHIHLIKAVDEFFSHKYDFTYEVVIRYFGAFLFCLRKRDFKNFKLIISEIQFKEVIIMFLILPYILCKRVLLYIKSHRLSKGKTK